MPLFDYLQTHPFGALDTEPTPSPTVVYRFRPDIVSLRDNTPSLAGVATVGWGLGSRIDTTINGLVKAWLLTTGAADGTDLTGQVAPTDYNAITNNVHWVSGL